MKIPTQLLALLASLMLVFSAAPATGEPQAAGDADGAGNPGLQGWMERLIEEGIRDHQSYGDVLLQHAEELRLTDDQMGRIYRLHQANQQRIQGINKKLHDATRWAHRMFLDPAKDEAAIRQAARAHTAAFDELLETALKTRRDINAVLTAEQQARLSSLKPTAR